MKVDTSVGYEKKPKRIAGYKSEIESCECGCKKAYWYYKKIKKKKL